MLKGYTENCQVTFNIPLCFHVDRPFSPNTIRALLWIWYLHEIWDSCLLCSSLRFSRNSFSGAMCHWPLCGVEKVGFYCFNKCCLLGLCLTSFCIMEHAPQWDSEEVRCTLFFHKGGNVIYGEGGRKESLEVTSGNRLPWEVFICSQGYFLL